MEQKIPLDSFSYYQNKEFKRPIKDKTYLDITMYQNNTVKTKS